METTTTVVTMTAPSVVRVTITPEVPRPTNCGDRTRAVLVTALAVQTTYGTGDILEQYYETLLLLAHGVELMAEPFELAGHTAVIARQADEGAVSAREEP